MMMTMMMQIKQEWIREFESHPKKQPLHLPVIVTAAALMRTSGCSLQAPEETGNGSYVFL
jgi:hypothetical protein